MYKIHTQNQMYDCIGASYCGAVELHYYFTLFTQQIVQ
jgi:hypothetical protein